MIKIGSEQSVGRRRIPYSWILQCKTSNRTAWNVIPWFTILSREWRGASVSVGGADLVKPSILTFYFWYCLFLPWLIWTWTQCGNSGQSGYVWWPSESLMWAGGRNESNEMIPTWPTNRAALWEPEAPRPEDANPRITFQEFNSRENHQSFQFFTFNLNELQVNFQVILPFPVLVEISPTRIHNTQCWIKTPCPLSDERLFLAGLDWTPPLPPTPEASAAGQGGNILSYDGWAFVIWSAEGPGWGRGGAQTALIKHLPLSQDAL